MKEITVRFEESPSADGIEVVIRAGRRDAEVEALIDRIKNGFSDTVNAADGDGSTVVIRTADIISFSVDGKRTEVITADSRYFLVQSLQSLEKQLDEKTFIRISRYEIINLTKVVRYDFTLAGTLRIELEGGIETWASRRCIPAIRRRLSGKE
ncbi:MAG: LytTR family transcriptional regulator DNA-binding domain-containing protein [Ruminococcus sp.]|nr:LytTR family transcriptional regulator DNA-binding domain-containing protein [Ruminococcus sp.]